MIAHNIPTLAVLSMSDAFYFFSFFIDEIDWLCHNFRINPFQKK